MLALVLMPGLAVAVLLEADLEIVSFEVFSAPETVQVGEEFDIYLQKVIKNNGPDGVVDAVLTLTAQAPLGSSVAPTEIVQSVEDLGLGEVRTVIEHLIATLYDVGQQTFMFTNMISLDDSFLDAGWSDPDQENNQASLEVDIDVMGVPEPTTLALLSLGLVGLGVARKKKKT